MLVEPVGVGHRQPVKLSQFNGFRGLGSTAQRTACHVGTQDDFRVGGRGASLCHATPDHLRGEAERRPRAPLMFDLTDNPACAGRGPLGVPAQASVPARRLVSRPTEAATPRARASASPTRRTLLRAEHRDAPLHARGGPCGRGGIIVVCRQGQVDMVVGSTCGYRVRGAGGVARRRGRHGRRDRRDCRHQLSQGVGA